MDNIIKAQPEQVPVTQEQADEAYAIESSSEGLVERIGKLHQVVKSACEHARTNHETSIKKAIEAGQLLEEAKKAVGFGKWETWLDDHRKELGFQKRRAQEYMLLASQAEHVAEYSKTHESAFLTLEKAIDIAGQHKRAQKHYDDGQQEEAEEQLSPLDPDEDQPEETSQDLDDQQFAQLCDLYNEVTDGARALFNEWVCEHDCLWTVVKLHPRFAQLSRQGGNA